MNLFKILALSFALLFTHHSYSKNLYIKAELPIYQRYKELDKEQHKQYTKKSKDISDSHGFGLGYSFSDYIEAEVVFNQMRYLYFASVEPKFETMPNLKPKINLQPGEYLAFAKKYKSGDGRCSNIPNTFLDWKDIYDSYSSTDLRNKQLLKKYDQDFINMKLNVLIASLKFKVPTKKRLVPFITLGTGVSRMKIDKKSESLNKDTSQINLVIPTLKNKTSFAYRVGIGMKFKISEKSALEVSARYFDYGKYKLSNGDQRKIKGHDFSAGIVLGF